MAGSSGANEVSSKNPILLTLDVNSAARYHELPMIRSFRNRETERVYQRETSRRFSAPVVAAALRKLLILDGAESLQDLRVPPGNRLEALQGDRQGQLSIRINDQWRICFRWSEGDAYDVEITDYH
jgi:proteic killer suppression protein